MDFKLGFTAWLVAAAHELPQELGDFGVLVHGKWAKESALVFNFLSGLTFLVGGWLAYFMSTRLDVAFLVPFAAGNFLYIGAADHIPEIKKGQNLRQRMTHLLAFLLGLGFCSAFIFFCIREGRRPAFQIFPMKGLLEIPGADRRAQCIFLVFFLNDGVSMVLSRLDKGKGNESRLLE